MKRMEEDYILMHNHFHMSSPTGSSGSSGSSSAAHSPSAPGVPAPHPHPLTHRAHSVYTGRGDSVDEDEDDIHHPQARAPHPTTASVFPALLSPGDSMWSSNSSDQQQYSYYLLVLPSSIGDVHVSASNAAANDLDVTTRYG